MTTEWTLWQQIALLGLASLALCYVLYFRLWLAWAVGCDLLFATALGVAIASVAAPSIFERLAAELTERSPLPAALQTVDERVTDLESLPGELIARALAKVGYESDPETLDPSPPEPGPFESQIRPSIEALLAGLLRATSLGCATFLLLTALAMRSSTSTAQRLREITLRLEMLEADAGNAGTRSSTHAARLR